ncbi:MAG: hypothetical protein Q7S39_11055, partial [Ignavibacteria bacterium]|nr:hypothetical protein [Ignavibacteria bacterium]
EDLAIDAIATLFTKDDLPIKKAFDNWQPPIKTEEEFLFFLNKVVANRVEQHITQLLKESDPLFPTILNSVNYLIKKNGNAKTKYLGSIYIIESGANKISGKIINRESFDLIPAEQFSESKILLQNLFFYIKTETDFFPAIPLNVLVYRFKELKTSGYIFNDKVESPVRTYEINEFVKKGLAAVEGKLRGTYVANSKLTKNDAQKFFKALKDISEDLKDGGVNSGLYEYLKPYYEDLSVEDYKEKYHNILEYLFKVMRNTIAEELKK